MAGGGWKIIDVATTICCFKPVQPRSEVSTTKLIDLIHWNPWSWDDSIFPMALEAVAWLFLQLLMSLVSWRRMQRPATDDSTWYDMLAMLCYAIDIGIFPHRFPINFIDIFWEFLSIYQHFTFLFCLLDDSKLTSPAGKSLPIFFPV